MKVLIKGLWKIVSFFEKVYWFLRKKNQLAAFKSVGENVRISRHCYFTGNTINVGNNVYIGKNCLFESTLSDISIGNNVMFGPHCAILGGNHRIDIKGRYMIDIRLDEKLKENDQDIHIEDDVWLGYGVVVLNGVRIGEGSVIGARSVITKNVPPYSIIVGNKERKVYQRWNNDEIKIHKAKLNKQ